MGEVIRFQPRLRAMPLITAEQVAVKEELTADHACKHCNDTGWHVWIGLREYFREPCPCGASDCLNEPDDPDFDGAA